MSLLDDVSIVVTPNGYKAGTLYGVLPTYAEGIDLVDNGDFATDLSGWNITGNDATHTVTWTASGARFQSDTTSPVMEFKQLNLLLSGKQYVLTCNIAYTGVGQLRVNVGTNLTPFTEGANTKYFTATSSTMSFLRENANVDAIIDNVIVKEVTASDMDVTRATAATRVDESGLIADVLSNVPRIDYTGGGCPHILAEPMRTNEITQNNQFDTTWVSSNLGLTSGQNGIYNTTDAWLFNATNSLANVTISVSTSGENTYSVYAKAGTEDGIFIRFTGGSNPRAFFNLTNGTLISESGTTNTNVENVGNGWYRCSVTGSETITDARIYVADASGNFVSSGNIYVQYSQLENGSYSTSIIPTSGGTVTRNKDIFTRDGIGSLINSTEGVLFVEMAALSDDGVAKYLTMNDGSSNNDVRIYFNTASNGISALLKSGTGATQAFLSYTVTDTTEFHKIAFVYAVNRFELWVDGEKRAEELSGFAPVGLNTLEFSRPSNFLPLFAKVKQLQVYTTALSPTQLAALTS